MLQGITLDLFSAKTRMLIKELIGVVRCVGFEDTQDRETMIN